MKLMNIDKEQADLIYNLKLKQLKSINQKELETNLENTIKEIEEITETLNKEEKLIQYMIKEWTEIKEKY
jgi:DNA gyrase/topoisomerase IV subunit A